VARCDGHGVGVATSPGLFPLSAATPQADRSTPSAAGASCSAGGDAFGADPVARATRLVSLFAEPGDEFARLRVVSPQDVPEPARRLLDHCSHMTVAMEGQHGSPLGLRVVARTRDSLGGPCRTPWYAREILLLSPQGQPVQYGIVRIDLAHVDAATARAIRAARVPLGRVLINAGLLREVHDVKLLEVVPGPRLGALFGYLPKPGVAVAPTFGRVAEISLGGHSAVELFEVVVPPPVA